MRDRDWLIHRYDRVASTMEQAAALAREGVPERTAVVAREQSAGRGRSGRHWVAPAGTALLCTLVVRPRVAADRLPVFPLIVGVAVADAIEQVSGGTVALKWPNDLWMGNDVARRKVGGILVTSRLRGEEIDYILAGIGVNLSPTATGIPPGATTVHAASGVDVTPDELLSRLLTTFDDAYARYLDAEGRPSLDLWRARAAMVDEEVVIDDNGRQLQGTFTGVDEDGALLLIESTGTLRRVVAGDLTRGPRGVSQSP
jgi:BirA family biotin operon repressor/biotin-[acetyl-CoA-carboxylase] ligase